MTIEVVCECGKQFNARDEYAGRRGLCPACKRIFDVPVPGAVIEPPLALAPSLPPPLPEGVIEEIEELAADSKISRRPFWRDPVVVIGSTFPSVILLAFLVYLYGEYSTRQFLVGVYESKRAADAMAASEKSKRAAFGKYEEILAAIQARGSTSPMVKKYADATKQSRDKLYPLVKAEIDEEKRKLEAEREAVKVLAERKIEADRLAGITGSVTGGAWVINKLGQSNVLRGLEIALLAQYVGAADVADVLEEAKNRAAFAEGFYLGATKAPQDIKTAADREQAATIAGLANGKRSIQERAKRILALAPKHPVDLKEVYKIIRASGFQGSEFDVVMGDKLWSRVVARLRTKETNTTIDAKYKFADIAGGKYYMYALHSTSQSLVEWLAPIDVEKSGEIAFDFFNGSAVTIANKSD
jgi:hypothetical protein